MYTFINSTIDEGWLDTENSSVQIENILPPCKGKKGNNR